jgi:hypothetical protein
MDDPRPIPPDAIDGKRLIPIVSIGCLAFAAAMILFSYLFWVNTKDYFIERAAQEGHRALGETSDPSNAVGKEAR